MSERQRLDVLVWQRGLALNRTQARALVLAGAIAVDGQRITQAGVRVPPEVVLTRLQPPSRYVSRGGEKLAAGLNTFALNVHHCVAMDIGASTGGFTDCLLQAGAQRVYAVDVGYGQLHWRLRTDPRVIVHERTNARHLQPQDIPERVSVMTLDVSFISLRLLFPVLVSFLTPSADVVALVKPQFEVGKGRVGKGGIVQDPQQQYQALYDVLHVAQTCELSLQDGIVSPLRGAKGNREFLVHLRWQNPLSSVAQIQAVCTRLAFALTP